RGPPGQGPGLPDGRPGRVLQTGQSSGLAHAGALLPALLPGGERRQHQGGSGTGSEREFIVSPQRRRGRGDKKHKRFLLCVLCASVVNNKVIPMNREEIYSALFALLST